jgi:hypothetical protein
VTVASERRIAANRRNAKQSTGPRSSAAKKRTSRNAFRHGLTLSSIANPALSKRLDRLARKIAGNCKDKIILEHARAAAHAALDLARVRRVKVAVINRVYARGVLDAPWDIATLIKAYLYLELASEGQTPRGRPPAIPELVDPLASMPNQEPERTAEAIRRALPELRRLDRYEARAIARRDRAIREIVKIGSNGDRRSERRRGVQRLGFPAGPNF